MKPHLLGLWNNSQKSLNSAANKLTAENIRFKLNPNTASLGFLMLHISETQLSLAKLFFGLDLNFNPTLAYSDPDDGREISGEVVRENLIQGGRVVAEIIENLKEEDWAEIIETRFGKLSRFDALLFIISHSSYHLGQAILTLKKGV